MANPSPGRYSSWSIFCRFSIKKYSLISEVSTLYTAGEYTDGDKVTLSLIVVIGFSHPSLILDQAQKNAGDLSLFSQLAYPISPQLPIPSESPFVSSVSYKSGRSIKCPNSWQKTPIPTMPNDLVSGHMAKSFIVTPSYVLS